MFSVTHAGRRPSLRRDVKHAVPAPRKPKKAVYEKGPPVHARVKVIGAKIGDSDMTGYVDSHYDSDRVWVMMDHSKKKQKIHRGNLQLLRRRLTNTPVLETDH